MMIHQFTLAEAEFCPGPWIASCGKCGFNTKMPASGYFEALRIATERHRTMNAAIGNCSDSEMALEVGRVPDISEAQTP